MLLSKQEFQQQFQCNTLKTLFTPQALTGHLFLPCSLGDTHTLHTSTATVCSCWPLSSSQSITIDFLFLFFWSSALFIGTSTLVFQVEK